MSKAAPPSLKKRKLEDGMRGKIQKPRKRVRKQKEYHSSSEDQSDRESGFVPVDLNDSDEEGRLAQGSRIVRTQVFTPGAKSRDNQSEAIEEDENGEGEEGEEDEEDDDDDDDDDDADSDSQLQHGQPRRQSSKRNDPAAFSTSMSKILSTKLSQSARKDPVLSRSKEAAQTSRSIVNEKLEHRAKAKMRAEKKEELERGRIKDVRGLSTGESGKAIEEERRLRKIAQRGVVKLFNAVRAAQVRGEQAAREERKKGTVGMAHREEKVNEMSKQGFLELISGKAASTADVREA